MSSHNDDPDYSIIAAVLLTIVLLTIGLAVGVGAHSVFGGGNKGKSAAAATAVMATETSVGATAAPAAPASQSSADASVVVEDGVVKFYFASGKAELAPGALDALADAIAAAAAGKRLVLSGFHDATGDPAMNAELAKQRALSVRDALVGAGVAESSVELKKPEVATGSGNDAEARRVEVMIVG